MMDIIINAVFQKLSAQTLLTIVTHSAYNIMDGCCSIMKSDKTEYRI